MGRKIKAMHFRSKESYRKWLAYGHIHGVFEKTPGHVKVYIRGKPHKVKHTKKRSRKNGKGGKRKSRKRSRKRGR